MSVIQYWQCDSWTQATAVNILILRSGMGDATEAYRTTKTDQRNSFKVTIHCRNVHLESLTHSTSILSGSAKCCAIKKTTRSFNVNCGEAYETRKLLPGTVLLQVRLQYSTAIQANCTAGTEKDGSVVNWRLESAHTVVVITLLHCPIQGPIIDAPCVLGIFPVFFVPDGRL